MHEYVWETFGPRGTRVKKSWIENCGLCGAPDDVVKGEHLLLMRDPVEKIVRLLR